MEKALDYSSLYIDFDSFFARAEQHLRPELRERPVGVVPLVSNHTVLIAASPEAKAFGLKTGTPVLEARQKCPGIVFVTARHDAYVHLHHRIVEIVDGVVPVQKTCSIDEIACKLLSNERANAMALARAIKRALADCIGPTLTCSIGLAPNELLAKIAAEMEKPDGLVAQGYFRQSQHAAGRRVRSLYEDQKLSLACQRTVLPRLSFAARRPGRSDFPDADPLAERVRKIGGTTLRSMGHIGRLQRIKDNDADYVQPLDMLAELREDNKDLVAHMRTVHDLCDEHKDVATASLPEVWIDEAERRL